MFISEKLYPGQFDDESYSYGPSNYNPIVQYLGQVIIKQDDKDYRGDSRILYKGESGRYGYLIFGWGSCSGCDSLQRSESYEDIDRLINFLKTQLKWFDSLDELKEYFKTKDWELDWEWHSDETKRFIKDVLDYNE